MIDIIEGDLLEATEKYIVHQTNCISNGGAAGLAASLFEKYPYADCYINRTEPSKPGTIDIRGNGQDQRFVINLHGQVYPGGIRYPLSDLDGEAVRETYFYRGLLRIAKIENLESIAFPFLIGCGIAGGNWDHYLQNIINFSKYVYEQNGVSVKIYKLPGLM